MPSSMVYALVIGAVVVLEGAAMASVPWLVRSTECFAVTVPEAMASDPRFVGLKRRYSAIVGALSAATAVATGVACLLDPEGAVGAVALPVGIAVFMAVCMTFAHVAIVRSKRGVDAGAPATTASGARACSTPTPTTPPSSSPSASASAGP